MDTIKRPVRARASDLLLGSVLLFLLSSGLEHHQESPPLTNCGDIRGQLAGGLSSCAWKPERVPLTPNLKYQQRSIAAACHLLSSRVLQGQIDT